MKKTYIIPAIEEIAADTTSLCAQSLVINADKSGDQALVNEAGNWSLWDDTSMEE